MKRIGFNVPEEIENLERGNGRTKKNENKDTRREPELKRQRLGTGYVEFYLEAPFH